MPELQEELLAERELLGYPNTTVQIHVIPNEDNIVFSRVVVIDPQGETELSDPQAYMHPFVFGYDSPLGS